MVIATESLKASPPSLRMQGTAILKLLRSSRAPCNRQQAGRQRQSKLPGCKL